MAHHSILDARLDRTHRKTLWHWCSRNRRRRRWHIWCPAPPLVQPVLHSPQPRCWIEAYVSVGALDLALEYLTRR
jgi:hypothetical protein